MGYKNMVGAIAISGRIGANGLVNQFKVGVKIHSFCIVLK